MSGRSSSAISAAARCATSSASKPAGAAARVVLSEARVAFVPGEAFGAPGYVRLSFALGDDDLVEGVSRIQKLLD